MTVEDMFSEDWVRETLSLALPEGVVNHRVPEVLRRPVTKKRRPRAPRKKGEVDCAACLGYGVMWRGYEDHECTRCEGTGLG
jgi:hypothetical protein